MNDNLIYVAPDNGTQLIVVNGKVNDGLGIKSCERGKLWQQNINKDLTKLLRLGKNTLKIRVVVSGTGQASLEFLLKNRCCVEYVEKWTEICDNKNNPGSDKCRLTSKLCTKKDVKMIFEGKNIEKKCITYDVNYSCESKENSCLIHDDDCSVYDVSGCSLESKEFMDKTRTLEKFIYRCLIPRDTKKDCDKQINCLDGNCYDLAIVDDNTQDMQKTITVLTTLNESVKTIDMDSLTMLNGENLKCRKSTGAIVSFKDCCGDANWGNKLSGCSSAEEKLKAKRENKDCIYVGSYCSDYKNLGIRKICITKKYSYCCFSNKFSKIIGNALRQQGLQNWGNAKNTNCNGILINNLNRLDFNKIDFSELYSDIKTNVNQEAMAEKIRQNLERLRNVK